MLLAFIFILLIETIIVSLFLKPGFSRAVLVLLKANIFTTILGYIGQGVLRFISGIIIIPDTDSENEIMSGLTGTVFLDKPSDQLDNSVKISLITSIIIAFIISLVIERKILLKEFNKEFTDKRITLSILVANLASYVLLFAWIYYNYWRIYYRN